MRSERLIVYKENSQSLWEPKIYELKPFLYLFLTMIVYVRMPHNDWAKYFAFLLLACTALIGYQRLRNRGYF